MTSVRERFDEHPVAITALLLLGLGLTAAIIGIETFTALIFVVGFAVVVPLVYLLSDTDDEAEGAPSSAPDVEDDPIEDLRRRYATGELSDAEFERKLDRLLETEDLDAGGRLDPAGRDEVAAHSRDRDIERERE